MFCFTSVFLRTQQGLQGQLIGCDAGLVLRLEVRRAVYEIATTAHIVGRSNAELGGTS